MTERSLREKSALKIILIVFVLLLVEVIDVVVDDARELLALHLQVRALLDSRVGGNVGGGEHTVAELARREGTSGIEEKARR